MVTLTERAAAQIQDLLEKQDKTDHALRVWIQGGGCSGLQYGMGLEVSPSDDDETFESHGVRVVVDPQSLPYLDGSEIDYVETLMGAGFRVDNPNAVASCGCGQSFRTGESGDEAADGCGSCPSARR